MSSTPDKRKMSKQLLDSMLHGQDGHDLVRMQLAVSPSILMLGVYAVMINPDSPYSRFKARPPKPLLDYLEEAISLMGLPEIAMFVQKDYFRACTKFKEAGPGLNIEEVTKNLQASLLLVP